MDKMKPTTVLLSPELAAGLKRVKKDIGIPEGEQIRRALREWLEARGALATEQPETKQKGRGKS